MVKSIEAVPDRPDPSLLQETIAARILDAWRSAHEKLRALGIPHAIVGGVAVGAWGHPRATKDVDFLVREADAFDAQGGILAFKPGVPIQVEGVPTAYLTVESLGLRHPPALAEEGGIVALELLFLLKLKAHRMQDDADVVALLKKGAPAASIDAWLRNGGFRPEAERLARLVEVATSESR